MLKSRQVVRPIANALCTCCFLALTTHSASAQVDQEQAAAYFEEAATLCEREAGRLWGVSLCGPMVFADPTTGTIATNRPEPDAPRPRVLGYANAALEWGDERWSTFVWQMIPKDEVTRAQWMLHELFHRIQPQLGLFVPTSQGTPDHLDTIEGRYWMQLEWRALTRALLTSGSEKKDAVRDALAFRRERRALTPGAAESEQVVEINEGLAQYTGTVAALTDAEEISRNVIQQLERAPEKESFVRTFAYPSGAAYGVLLYEWSHGWTGSVQADHDLGELIAKAAALSPAQNAEASAKKYGGAELRASEMQREEERQARIAELRRRFVEGPVLTLPRGRNASFITTGVTPIPGAGTIYPTYRVAGEWGSIEADQVLVSEDGRQLTVPGPVTIEGSTLSGDGWVATRAEGWAVRPGPRKGDMQLIQVDP